MRQRRSLLYLQAAFFPHFASFYGHPLRLLGQPHHTLITVFPASPSLYVFYRSSHSGFFLRGDPAFVSPPLRIWPLLTLLRPRPRESAHRVLIPYCIFFFLFVRGLFTQPEQAVPRALISLGRSVTVPPTIRVLTPTPSSLVSFSHRAPRRPADSRFLAL